ncbi:NAD(P)/FAD-dependent oxidoreductase [Clostridium cylindrosporum]|uniref:FAD dependent oxidoreductase n=1 Tax=Clostridium cylindrosporum DSM 605 TaxID=1121307 RepID=A0A0J8G5Z7_CLOCY|nr:FAD-dependent oxidoreductase [Clostridium cylindrosporum]KMT23036.1 FAD dependent oxidoreductase [Clostridium cylindrosporum DSM 605]
MSIPYVRGKSIFNCINTVPKQYPYLVKDIETEVIIVGGGATGAILGYYFTKNGIPSVVLEKSRIAHCSTGITTSLLQYELDSRLEELKNYGSLDKFINAYKLGLKALDEIKDFIDAYGNKCDYKVRDTLFYTSKSLEYNQVENEYKLRQDSGFDVEFITPSNNPFSFNVEAGVYSINGGAELDPYKFTHQLLDASTQNGLRVYENSEVIDVNFLENEVEAITKYNHKVKGKILIVATGYNTSLFTNRNFGTKYTTFNVATKPLKEIKGWHNNALIRDNKGTYNYFRTTNDNRIIAGGEDISFLPDIFNEKAARESYDILEQKIKHMFPSIPNIQIEYKYCGTFASTKDNLGFIGKDPKQDKLLYCLGYGANGILFAILGGLMLPNLYKGSYNTDLDLFKVDRFDS